VTALGLQHPSDERRGRGLPFVPVTAITRPRSQRDASSSSPMISTARVRATSKAGWVSGTPGLTTIRSAAPIDAGS
jgi:hypothetical protein